MVGIPKSNRCTFCKLRKTKCDENWPTCGTCARADKVCSGARSTYKFVVNGSHNEVITTPAQPDSHHDTIIPLRSNSSQLLQDISSKPASPGDAIIVDMKEYTASRGPGTFHRMRLTQARRPRSIKSSRLTPTPTPTPAATPSPRSSPVLDPSDRLAGQLVACLEAAADTGHDMQIWGPSIRIIPQRLRSESRVLRHTVELVVATWSNSRRDVLAPELWLDLSLHMRALGSLRKALEEPEPEPESEELGLGLVTDTIAAQWLLQKLELTYDFERGANREHHAAGLTAVISRGGPYQHFNDLRLFATLDSFYNMLQEDVRLGRDSVFMRPEWKSAFYQAINSSTLQPALKAMYRLWVEMAVWPALARLVRLLCQDPSDSMAAAELLLRATPVIEWLDRENETTITSLVETGRVAEVENFLDQDMFATCYQFRDADTAKYFYTHAMFNIIISRTMQEANLVLERHDPSATKRCSEYSRRIWMCYPWMRTRRPLAVEYTGALAFSYESANNEEEREFCVRGLEGMEYFRRPPPVGQWIDATIMANVKAYTGRLPFIKNQDVTIELCGLGCRF